MKYKQNEFLGHEVAGNTKTSRFAYSRALFREDFKFQKLIYILFGIMKNLFHMTLKICLRTRCDNSAATLLYAFSVTSLHILLFL